MWDLLWWLGPLWILIVVLFVGGLWLWSLFGGCGAGHHVWPSEWKTSRNCMKCNVQQNKRGGTP